MPEGDTLFRTAAVLREVLLGRHVTGARGRPGGAQMGRVVGSRVDRVDSLGKHLLIGFDDGLSLHTHLGMNGSWHRYRPGERWRRSPARAVCVIEDRDGGRGVLRRAGRRAASRPARWCSIRPSPGWARTSSSLRRTWRPLSDGWMTRRGGDMTIGEALLDQRAMAGLGNVYRSEVLFLEGVDPFLPVHAVDRPCSERLVATGAACSARTGTDPAGRRHRMPGPPARRRAWHAGRIARTGRPCRRYGTHRAQRVSWASCPGRLWWCPTCQVPAGRRRPRGGLGERGRRRGGGAGASRAQHRADLTPDPGPPPVARSVGRPDAGPLRPRPGEDLARPAAAIRRARAGAGAPTPRARPPTAAAGSPAGTGGGTSTAVSIWTSVGGPRGEREDARERHPDEPPQAGAWRAG